VVLKLEGQRFLDDGRFAGEYVRYCRRRLRSDRITRMELKSKGVAEELIEAALADSDDEFGGPESASEHDRALELASKRIRSMSGLPRDTIYRRLGGQLARRGFSPGTVREVLGEVLDSMGELYGSDD
jgi:regulatory protein